ncbi:MAG TPA: rRNA adenine dimethyltransferase family protein [Nitrosopumilaceae archaeon]|nr:rRNA adenine dimethyltransferase family protein [Nitrosopumilaceae archaeon]
MIKRQRLGQHFLHSQSVAKKIVESADITKKDTVLEIGTGKGILVPLLCEKAGHVISIESDLELYNKAKEKFSDVSNLALVHGDGFESDEKFTVFVSNLPYSKSRDAMEWLVQKKFRQAVVMVQKEFFEKIAEKNKAVSVLVNHSADIESIINVNKNNFSPPPNVDSVVLRLTQKNTIPKKIIQVVNRLFSYKRKKIQNIAKQFGKIIESDKRLEDLSGDEIISLAKQILK